MTWARLYGEDESMIDWDEERADIRAWLHPRCKSRQEFEFWDAFFDDLTDWFDGLDCGESGGIFGDPVTWYMGVATAEHSASMSEAYAAERRFKEEAWDRGYKLP